MRTCNTAERDSNALHGGLTARCARLVTDSEDAAPGRLRGEG